MTRRLSLAAFVLAALVAVPPFAFAQAAFGLKSAAPQYWYSPSAIIGPSYVDVGQAPMQGPILYPAFNQASFAVAPDWATQLARLPSPYSGAVGNNILLPVIRQSWEAPEQRVRWPSFNDSFIKPVANTGGLCFSQGNSLVCPTQFMPEGLPTGALFRLRDPGLGLVTPMYLTPTPTSSIRILPGNVAGFRW